MFHTFRLKAYKIPEVVMRTLASWYLIVRLRLYSVNDIGELDRLLNEEDWNVVTNNIPVAFVGVEFYSEASHIAYSVLIIVLRKSSTLGNYTHGATTRTLNSAEADKDGCCPGRIC